MNKDALIAAGKEAARLGILAFVSVLVTSLMSFLGTQDQSSTVVFALTGALRVVDYYIHKNDSIKANGLLPF